MTRAPTDRSHLSIGEVLSLLQEEFPDVTISKIRFLESQGLLDPERTPSGYRKFYEADIDRLRWILRQQKDHYLPLKVIKDRLDETGPVRTAPTAASPSTLDESVNGADPATVPAMAATGPATASGPGGPAGSGVALDDRPRPARERPRPGRADDHRSDRRQPDRRPPDRREPDLDVADVIEPPTPRRPAADPTLLLSPRPGTGRRPAGAAPPGRPAPGDPGAVALTADELVEASGLPARALRELEGFGLLESHQVGDTSYYDADALVIARTAAAFLEHGIEARHIRSYKVAAEREAGLFEQIVLPLLKQRNPDAKRRANQTIAELVRLGDTMRGVLLRRGLRDHIPPP
ncbi:MAG TPA: MerR family transcriptional regulator [Acidimicrobiales bacterium]|nr:MerR family transcriptional regulator [Acidimicrobiales bacterium]